jgi:GTP cyclohydrolase FolE2
MSENSIFDVHYEKPLHSIDISWAGIKKARVPPIKLGDIWLVPEVSIYVDLPGAYRGVHVSRLYKAILLVKRLPEEGLSVIETIATRVLSDNEYAERARVTLSARVISEESSEFRGYRYIRVGVILDKSGVREYESSASTVAITSCPCALKVAEQLYSKPYTHTSKLRVTVTIKSKRSLIDSLRLLTAMSRVLSELNNYLKREQEAMLLRNSIENPLFAEDVVRLLTVCAVRECSDQLDPRDVIIATAKSIEPLHEYGLYVVLKATIGSVLDTANATSTRSEL